MMRSQPSIDALLTIGMASDMFGAPTDFEVHILVFLGSAIAGAIGPGGSEWGYGFSRTRDAAVHSAELQRALDLLVSGGYLSEGTEYGALSLTDRGTTVLSSVRSQSPARERARYLIAAAEAALVLNPAMLVRGVSNRFELGRDVLWPERLPSADERRGLRSDIADFRERLSRPDLSAMLTWLLGAHARAAAMSAT